ncbi:MAG: tetratricopeptide repeat protein [Balneolales bacterium]|nr:tetratricopeptide repeat protein [Balneolales bacterium]
MMQVKKILSGLVLAALLFAGSIQAQAQDRAAAVEAFNAAQELVRANQFNEALDKFQETRRIAQAAGSDADDIRERAESQIPGVVVQLARANYQARNFAEAVEDFDRAGNFAAEFGNSQVAQQAANNVLIVKLQWGNSELNAGNLDEAAAIYKGIIERNPNYPNSYYQLGLVERRKGNLEEALTFFDQAIQVGMSVNRMEVASNAESAARNALFERGSTLIEEGNYRRAVQFLSRALEYDMEFADTYYRLAEAHNNLGNWGDAITNANRALQLETGGQVARAKIYFELGVAQMNQNNIAQACTSFKSAAFGSFRAAAEHHMEHDLSCP